jgi:hypothetical protein
MIPAVPPPKVLLVIKAVSIFLFWEDFHASGFSSFSIEPVMEISGRET